MWFHNFSTEWMSQKQKKMGKKWALDQTRPFSKNGRSQKKNKNGQVPIFFPFFFKKKIVPIFLISLVLNRSILHVVGKRNGVSRGRLPQSVHSHPKLQSAQLMVGESWDFQWT